MVRILNWYRFWRLTYIRCQRIVPLTSRHLIFNYSLLPVGFHRRATLTSLNENNVEVLWYPSEVWYRLNLNSGTWQVSSFRDINV
ncbi:uncharacterized protein [Apostichopus japonicus]|uniref:uncharacterized protein isoform X2 n=1 Tax=Stichopus japonicus TaxID=307972 RepID=UPI003AB393BC